MKSTRLHIDKVSRRNRPWLLLWLLPYLVFSIASDSFHSHDWTSGFTSSAALAHHHAAVSPQAALAAGGECFACDWAANSVSHMAVAVPTTVTRSVATARLPFRFSLHASPASSWHNRGPPLV